MPPLFLSVVNDRIVADFLAHAASKAGVSLAPVGLGADALARAYARMPRAVIIGLDLGAEAITLVRSFRSGFELSSVPILLVGRPGDEPRAVQGLEAGAIGLLKLPMDAEAATARLAELLQWRPTPEGTRVVIAGPVAIDLRDRRLIRPRSCMLAPCEFEVLRWLLVQQGRTYTRRQLLAIDRAAYPPVAEEWMIDANVQSLKRKLGEAGDWIEVVPAVGYRFGEPRQVLSSMQGFSA